MTRYRYTGQGDHYLHGGDDKLTPGDEIELEEEPAFPELFEEVSGAESGSSEEEDDSPSEDEESAESDSQAGQNESEQESEVDLPFSPQDLTVSELEAELSAGDFSDEEYEAMKAEEQDRDETRKTAIEAIEEAQGE